MQICVQINWNHIYPKFNEEYMEIRDICSWNFQISKLVQDHLWSCTYIFLNSKIISNSNKISFETRGCIHKNVPLYHHCLSSILKFLWAVARIFSIQTWKYDLFFQVNIHHCGKQSVTIQQYEWWRVCSWVFKLNSSYNF